MRGEKNQNPPDTRRRRRGVQKKKKKGAAVLIAAVGNSGKALVEATAFVRFPGEKKRGKAAAINTKFAKKRRERNLRGRAPRREDKREEPGTPKRGRPPLKEKETPPRGRGRAVLHASREENPKGRNGFRSVGTTRGNRKGNLSSRRPASGGREKKRLKGGRDCGRMSPRLGRRGKYTR